VEARETVTPVGGVVGPVRQVDFSVHPYPPSCSRSPPVRKVRLASASPVGDSDTCKAEPVRGSELELWYGPSPRVSPRMRMQARFSPTGRPIGVTGPSGPNEVTAP
jgi:hypothetical protein